jgi:hypothetical protein
MKMKLNIINTLLVSIGLFLVITTSCEKKEDKTIASTLPEVTTSAVTSISSTTAQCGGTITSNGGHAITESGICYCTKPTPTLSDTFITNESNSASSYINTISGLKRGTTYYVRAYAINSQGASYGNIRSFTTLTIEITLSDVTSVLMNTAESGATITNYGASAITKCGICWNTSTYPTITNSCTDYGSIVGGSFPGKMTKLTAGTKYYVRAYVTTDKGTYYSPTTNSFTTINASVKDTDNNVYPTAQFGDQIWMTENLITTKYNNGIKIALIKDSATWSDNTSDAYCFYNNTSEVCGALYNFYTVSTNKLCPTGWHVPNQNEWNTLQSSINGNLSVFNIDMGGYRDFEASFKDFGSKSYWWTSSSSSNYAYSYSSTTSYFNNNSYRKNTGNSVRCMKNQQ